MLKRNIKQGLEQEQEYQQIIKISERYMRADAPVAEFEDAVRRYKRLKSSDSLLQKFYDFITLRVLGKR